MENENNQVAVYHADDDNLIRDLISKVIDFASDCKLESQFPDGEGLLSILKEGVSRPAVVITDYRMPNVNGGELVEMCANDPRYSENKVPVILISGDLDDVDLSTKKRAYATFGKPFNLMELKSTIEEAAEYSRNSLND
ncbi:MAG: response regulator [Nanoarchaeota archaeon]|nr:response regulator [Nanoarchaeota archaeon]MBU1501720.1 response regulator [Nanoarchaeota archaeon]